MNLGIKHKVFKAFMLKVFKLSCLKTFVNVASPLKCKSINGGIEILFFFRFQCKICHRVFINIKSFESG